MQALLARALAGQGKEAEAREAADRARNLLDANPNIKNRLLVNILVADVDVDGAGFPDRRRRLAAILRETVSAGYVPLQLEARLALGKLELEYGSADAGRRLLNELAREASRKGFRLVARKAREAMAAR